MSDKWKRAVEILLIVIDIAGIVVGFVSGRHWMCGIGITALFMEWIILTA